MKRTTMTGEGGSEGVTEPKRVKDVGHSATVAELESSSKVASAGELGLGLAARGGKVKEKKKEKQFDWSL